MKIKSSIFLFWESQKKLFTLELFLFLGILFVGAFVRLFYLGEVPAGLNQDEASMAYDVYSLLYYGIDRNSMSFPVHMIAWGSGQNALLGYLSMPFIRFFGLNVLGIRLLPSLLGILCVVLIYKETKRIASVSVGLFSAFLLAISPWHITASRWALESNLLPTMLLLAFYFLIQAQKRKKFLWVPALFFALALYAYSPAYAFVPIFGVVYCIYALIHHFYSLKQWIGAFLVFIVIAWPIGAFLFINYFHFPSLDLYFFSIPHLPGSPRYSQMSSFFSADFWETTKNSFLSVIDVLFIKGNDGETQNTVSNVGAIYLLSIPFFGIGFIKTIVELIQKRRDSLMIIILFWFLVSFVVACFSTPAMHRMNMIFFPMIIITAYGLSWLWQLSRSASVVILFLYIFFFIRFLNIYFTSYADEIGDFFFESYIEAVAYAYEKAVPLDTIYLSDDLNQPYIHVLFTTQYDVREYVRSVKIDNRNAAFQIIRSFGPFVFGVRTPEALRARVLVVKNNELTLFDLEDYWVNSFKNFTVLFDRNYYHSMEF